MQLFVGQQGVPAVGHRRHQADLRVLAGFFGGEVLGQRLFLQAGNPAEEVDFPRRHGQAHLEGVGVVAVGVGLAGARHHTINRGVLVGAADLELRACLLDVQHRNTQVAVVLQRNRDQLLQARVGKVVLPGQVGGSHAAHRSCLGQREGRGDGRRGPLVGRDHAAARQHAGCCNQRQAAGCQSGGKRCHGGHSLAVLKHGRVPPGAGAPVWRSAPAGACFP